MVQFFSLRHSRKRRVRPSNSIWRRGEPGKADFPKGLQAVPGSHKAPVAGHVEQDIEIREQAVFGVALGQVDEQLRGDRTHPVVGCFRSVTSASQAS